MIPQWDAESEGNFNHRTCTTQLGWTAGSYFIQGSVALSERSKGSVRNVGDMVDFRQGMSAAFNQTQRSASTFWGPLKSLHDLIEPL